MGLAGLGTLMEKIREGDREARDGNYEAAEEHLLRALELSERHVAEERLRSSRGVLDSLARLYDAVGAA